MLKEAEIRTFIEGATNYFEVSAQQAASVGSPYLVTDGKPGAYEYTGVIGISGARKGIVYFTAPRGMLTVLLMRMNETDTSEENIKDLVGEVANTISGNARRDFGKNFVISVPDHRRARAGQVHRAALDVPTSFPSIGASIRPSSSSASNSRTDRIYRAQAAGRIRRISRPVFAAASRVLSSTGRRHTLFTYCNTLPARSASRPRPSSLVSCSRISVPSLRISTTDTRGAPKLYLSDSRPSRSASIVAATTLTWPFCCRW